jgi:hypothetical protein
MGVSQHPLELSRTRDVVMAKHAMAMLNELALPEAKKLVCIGFAPLETEDSLVISTKF